MTTKTQGMATARPWERRSIPGHLFEISSNGNPVLRIRGGMMPTLEDAELIVRAVNAHEELCDALRDLMKSCQNWAPTIDCSRARVALRKAGAL